MKKNINIIYFEKQYFHILIFPLFLLILAIIFLDIFNIGSKPIPTFFSILISIILFFTILLFYKMELIICKNYVKVKFGIGIIKKVIKNENILEIEEMSIPWYYGMGIRLIKNGYVYNTKPGNGLALITNKKKYVIVSNFHSKLYQTLIKQRTHLR